MAVEIEDLKTRLDSCEIANAKQAVTITGLETPKKKKDAIGFIEHFFLRELDITVNVEELFYMGSSKPRLCVVFFQTLKQKKEVMQLKKRLNEARSGLGRKIFINDYLPVAHQEKTFHLNYVLKQIEESEQNYPTSFQKGKLLIQGETYKAKVQPPTPKQIVDLLPQELDEILKMELNQTGRITKDKSIFEGFTATVSDFSQIRKLYIKAKLMQPAARHIVCAYYLPGCESHYNQNFCDDGEHGAGRHILDFMVKNNFINKVVFVSRKYGGIRMSGERYDCYKTATELVLQANPWNSLLKIKQVVKISAKDVTTKPIRYPPKTATNKDSQDEDDDQDTSNKRPASSPPVYDYYKRLNMDKPHNPSIRGGYATRSALTWGGPQAKNH